MTSPCSIAERAFSTSTAGTIFFSRMVTKESTISAKPATEQAPRPSQSTTPRKPELMTTLVNAIGFFLSLAAAAWASLVSSMPPAPAAAGAAASWANETVPATPHRQAAVKSPEIQRLLIICRLLFCCYVSGMDLVDRKKAQRPILAEKGLAGYFVLSFS
jgi:hypothetical protein